jgi:hypothetical protein
MSLDQLWDVHLSWVDEGEERVLILFPEFQSLLKADRGAAQTLVESYARFLTSPGHERHRVVFSLDRDSQLDVFAQFQVFSRL